MRVGTRFASCVGLALSALTLTACEPGVHIAWAETFNGALDYDCIGAALETVTQDVGRTTWVSDGFDAAGFPQGTEVTQFNYSDPAEIGHYSLNVAMLSGGKTHYFHQWGKIGTEVSDVEKARVLPLLNRANDAVAQKCGLSFADVTLEQGDG